jgi:hypothetical protein
MRCLEVTATWPNHTPQPTPLSLLLAFGYHRPVVAALRVG